MYYFVYNKIILNRTQPKDLLIISRNYEFFAQLPAYHFCDIKIGRRAKNVRNN